MEITIMLKIDYKGFTAELVSIGKEYSGVFFTKVPEEYNNISKEYCGGLHRTLQEKLIDMVDLIDYLIISKEQEKRDMKITFTFGDTVTINLTQNKEGFYNYTPKNNITSLIQFFSVKDAILFFSEFLPVKMYDKEENSLTFVVNIEYKNVGIAFYMFDEDRTKSGWTDYTTKSMGFSNFLKVNKKVEDSIDDTIKHFINFVDSNNKLDINGKTYLIKYEEEDKEYYTMFTPFLKITGKSVDEVKEKIKEIYRLLEKIINMTQEELQQLKVLLDKANQVLNFSENDGISVEFDNELKEFVLYGKCSREGVCRTVSSKGVEDENI